MEVVSKVASSEILKQGYKKFQYNFWRVLFTILFFPLLFFYSQRYIKKFLTFCYTYQRNGQVEINSQMVEFNSFEHYYQDSVQKGLIDCTCFVDFSKENYQEVTIFNHQQQPISALIVRHPQPTTKWVVGLHGWTENKYLALRLVSWFYAQGYNVVTFDSMAHGESYGCYSDIGMSSARDLVDIILWLEKHYQVSSVGLIGNSMGAATVGYYAHQYHQAKSKIKWVIADSPFTNLLVQYRYIMTYRYQKPWWLISFGLARKNKKFTATSIQHYSWWKKASDVPILLIHGQNDTFVPFFMSKMVYEANKNNSNSVQFDYLFIEQANHIESLFKHHQQYINQVENFIKTYQE